MQPISVQVPDAQCEAIAAEVDRAPGFDPDLATVVRVWLGPSLEIVLGESAADRLADALVDALATDDAGKVLYPATLMHHPV